MVGLHLLTQPIRHSINHEHSQRLGWIINRNLLQFQAGESAAKVICTRAAGDKGVLNEKNSSATFLFFVSYPLAVMSQGLVSVSAACAVRAFHSKMKDSGLKKLRKGS